MVVITISRPSGARESQMRVSTSCCSHHSRSSQQTPNLTLYSSPTSTSVTFCTRIRYPVGCSIRSSEPPSPSSGSTLARRVRCGSEASAARVTAVVLPPSHLSKRTCPIVRGAQSLRIATCLSVGAASANGTDSPCPGVRYSAASASAAAIDCGRSSCQAGGAGQAPTAARAHASSTDRAMHQVLSQSLLCSRAVAIIPRWLPSWVPAERASESEYESGAPEVPRLSKALLGCPCLDVS
mmetsp:Transcript_14692/g.47536  ORF Transcript_14692/g.47536 Transcript_14692/m.47536 type:complete len:239 (-) Transcript_14692:11-727(-)